MMLEKQTIQINGKIYDLCGQIGQGTVGHVFIIRNQQNQKYALKVIKQYGRNPIIKSMVNQQIEVQNQFKDNSHIIQIFDHKQQNKKKYIIFQLGTCSLRNRMHMQAHISLSQFIDIALDTTKGLTAIHNKNLIHRDIKPQNIICVQKTYKITDFGSLQAGRVGQGVIGTPLYLSPQMLFDEQRQYNQKIDIWSLGVSLFEVYFKIHPFYYSKEMQNPKLLYKQLKQNIKTLTPNFTIQKFLKNLLDRQLYQQYKQVKNKVDVTPKELIEQFTYFFNLPEDRPQIQIFNAVFQSLESTCRESHARKSKLKIAPQKIPSDIKFYTDTLNLFYELSSMYGHEKMEQIQFHLQLGLWYWNFYNYIGQDYIQYHHQKRLELYKKDKQILWNEVQQCLFNYFLEISSNSGLTFYEHLPILKVRILICGARYKIYKKLQKFLQSISKMVKMEIKDLEQLEMMLNVFEVIQLKNIEDTIVNFFYI